MEMEGFTTVTVGKATKVVSTGSAANNPLRVYEGGDIPYTDNYVTQIQFENAGLGDQFGREGPVGQGRQDHRLRSDQHPHHHRRSGQHPQGLPDHQPLDVASPKAKMELIGLNHATATDVQRIIEQLYGSEQSSQGNSLRTGAQPEQPRPGPRLQPARRKSRREQRW